MRYLNRANSIKSLCHNILNICVSSTAVRIYSKQGYRPTVFYPKPPSGGNTLYQSLATQCEKVDIPFLLYLPSEAQLIADSYSLLVDAIFGLGYCAPLSPDFATIVQTLVRSRVPAVSIELPSGKVTESDSTEGPCVRANRGKSAGEIRCPRNFYSKCITSKCLTLKMKVKVTEYNIYNGAIR